MKTKVNFHRGSENIGEHIDISIHIPDINRVNNRNCMLKKRQRN